MLVAKSAPDFSPSFKLATALSPSKEPLSPIAPAIIFFDIVEPIFHFLKNIPQN